MHHQSARGIQLVQYPESQLLGRLDDIRRGALLVIIISGVVDHAPAEQSCVGLIVDRHINTVRIILPESRHGGREKYQVQADGEAELVLEA